ncbi:MAG: sigma factor-like helix-turn-helix DNA-binding protein, partial [Pseudomonadota bacterium]|nr:sigma factor-like helix-turn-helix DNA-binding protein [Pseudomonadota bacterium]
PSDQAPADDAVAIRHAFAALPTDQRFAAQLFFVEGLTLAEIAQVQSIPLGTAKTRLFHARRKLKAALSGDDT